MLRKGHDAHAYWPRLRTVLAVAFATQECEVADTVRRDDQFLPAVAQILLLDDAAGAGDLLTARQNGPHGVDAGFVEERLVPGDEGRRLPAGVVVDGEDGKPVAKLSDAFPLSPASVLLRQPKVEVENERDGLALFHDEARRQRHDEWRIRGAFGAKRSCHLAAAGIPGS